MLGTIYVQNKLFQIVPQKKNIYIFYIYIYILYIHIYIFYIYICICFFFVFVGPKCWLLHNWRKRRAVRLRKYTIADMLLGVPNITEGVTWVSVYELIFKNLNAPIKMKISEYALRHWWRPRATGGSKMGNFQNWQSFKNVLQTFLL